MSALPTQFLQGTVDVLLLHALAAGPRHGYAVAEWLESASGRKILIEDAALYAALHRLEDRAWVASEWGLSEKGKRAKFYRLTPAGRSRLRRSVKSWEQYVSSVERVLATTPA
jgi:transcriptional regulator